VGSDGGFGFEGGSVGDLGLGVVGSDGDFVGFACGADFVGLSDGITVGVRGTMGQIAPLIADTSLLTTPGGAGTSGHVE